MKLLKAMYVSTVSLALGWCFTDAVFYKKKDDEDEVQKKNLQSADVAETGTVVVRSTMTNHLQVQLSAECWVLGAGFGAGLCAEVKLTLNLSAEKQKKKREIFLFTE